MRSPVLRTISITEANKQFHITKLVLDKQSQAIIISAIHNKKQKHNNKIVASFNIEFLLPFLHWEVNLNALSIIIMTIS